MTVALHNLNTDLYLVGPNMWTNDRAKALEFERMEDAVELAAQSGLDDLELVVTFSGAPGDIHLPLADAKGRTTRTSTSIDQQ